MMEDGTCVATPGTPTTCGPGTVLTNDECVIDPTSPAPVTEFAVTVSGSNMNLSWTAGTGSTGTLVARVESGKYDAPAHGVKYTAGMTLPGGSKVIAVGSATSATDAFTTPGRYSYFAFSQNASGNFGFGREASAVSLPAQSAKLSVDVAASTVTVMNQPANLALTAGNFAFDTNTGVLSFSLDAKNNTAGHLFNLKAVVTNITGGTTPTVDSPTGTTADGKPFVSVGFAALLPTEDTSGTVSLAGIGATDTLTIDVTLVESAMALLGTNIVDVGGGPAFVTEIPALRPANNNNAVAFSAGWFSPSARYLYAVTRYDTSLSRIDTTSGDVTSIPAITTFGHGSCLTVGHDGFLYAVFGIGGHIQTTVGGLVVAKIDPGSLTVVATTSISPDSDTQRSHTCAIAGTKLFADFGSGVYVVDTATMQFIDTNTATADVIDPIAIGVNTETFNLVATTDAATVYSSSRKSADIYSINTATHASELYHSASTGKVVSPVFADGKLWWGAGGWEDSGAGLWSFDGTTEASVPNNTDVVTAIGTVRGGKAQIVTANGPATVDLTTGEDTSTGLVSGGFRLAHVMTVAPTP
jgi:hypothetical protein